MRERRRDFHEIPKLDVHPVLSVDDGDDDEDEDWEEEDEEEEEEKNGEEEEEKEPLWSAPDGQGR